MKSSDLRDIRKISNDKRKKVLLINCRRKGYLPALMPHIGLGILAGILIRRGHEVLVIDYLLTNNVPPIEMFLKKFNPDVVGITSYTWNIFEVKKTIDEIRNFSSSLPVIIGGPHTSMFTDDFKQDKRIDYLVLGDGELLIIDLIEKAKRQKKPEILFSKELAKLDDIPFPNYQCFYKWETVLSYPLYTSRGCPHNCNYCSVWILCNRVWRTRSSEKCIEELRLAKKIFKKDLHVFVVDDSPAIDKKRFADFLRLYIKSRLRMRLEVYNMRADNITEEILSLLKKTGTKHFTVAVEHTDPEVCQLMDKHETIEQIENAINLVKKQGFLLTLFFVIGLPKDSFEKTKKLIKFARKFKPYAINWNIFQYLGPNRAVEWFKENGKVDAINYSQPSFKKEIFYPEGKPFAEYSGFTKHEIEKAYFMAILRTISPSLRLRDAVRIFKTISKYNLQADFFYWLPRGFLKSLRTKFYLFQSAVNTVRKEGIIKTLRKIIYLKKLGRL